MKSQLATVSFHTNQFVIGSKMRLVTLFFTCVVDIMNHSIQMLPLSQAIVLSFVNPVMASIAARVILHEKLKITDIGGTKLFPLALAPDVYAL